MPKRHGNPLHRTGSRWPLPNRQTSTYNGTFLKRIFRARRAAIHHSKSGIPAVRQKLGIRSHCGHDCAGLREQFSPPQTQEPQRTRFLGKNLEVRSGSNHYATVSWRGCLALLLLLQFPLFFRTKLGLLARFALALVLTSSVAHLNIPLILPNVAAAQIGLTFSARGPLGPRPSV